MTQKPIIHFINETDFCSHLAISNSKWYNELYMYIIKFIYNVPLRDLIPYYILFCCLSFALRSSGRRKALSVECSHKYLCSAMPFNEKKK